MIYSSRYSSSTYYGELMRTLKNPEGQNLQSLVSSILQNKTLLYPIYVYIHIWYNSDIDGRKFILFMQKSHQEFNYWLVGGAVLFDIGNVKGVRTLLKSESVPFYC